MKRIVFFALVAIGIVASDRVNVGQATEPTSFDNWRSCMKTKIPAGKQQIMDECVKKPGGTEMSKFRRGLGCVLDSYGVLSNNKVDLVKMSAAASSVTSVELKKAFTECPKDDRNTSRNRAIKCVIDNLETSCPVATA